jgi:hypothetical protein
MAEFDAKSRESRDGVNDETTPVTGAVIETVGGPITLGCEIN